MLVRNGLLCNYARTSQGIITVVDQSDEEEDEALVALRNLPKFEPLVVPEAASHFSLSSVFGALATSSDTRHDASERAFNPNVMVDILVQMNAHNKKCALDIQDYQRSLGLKMKALDEFTTGAVQELSSIHHQAKTHADHLLSALSMPKARASMALVSSALSYLTMSDPSELDQLSAHSTLDHASRNAIPENPPTVTALTGTSVSTNVGHTSLQQQLQQHNTPQQKSLRASDNLRRLANKSPSHAASTHQYRGRFI
ncbi:hypothetical protein BGZ75_003613 [Mortierella antarctica]|nr:hypothetical protein BGZ75_003613 [Mortierella antarctica]